MSEMNIKYSFQTNFVVPTRHARTLEMFVLIKITNNDGELDV